MSKRKVIWTRQAMSMAIEYIRKDSQQNADKVKEKLLNKINELANDNKGHRKDPHKKNNDGNYLYFEILKYRIVYYAQANEVFIIRIRHTGMEPKEY